jgi:phosphatidylserine decarboxylase
MMRIAKGGFSWIVVSFAFTFVFIGAAFFSTGPLLIFLGVVSVFLFLISCLLIVFFRDPERTIGHGIVAIADGKIREIQRMHDPEVGDCWRISTFMNIHNVHVNRMPFDGFIQTVTHHDGSHVPAFKKESDSNERMVLLIKTDIGLMKIVQIAGTVARRIVSYVSEGNTEKKGKRIGLIRLGSRVDFYLPIKRIKGLAIQVHDKVKAGEDTLAEVND